MSIFVLLVFASSVLNAKVSLPNIFSDHMVLQRNHENLIWGKANPGEKIQVSIERQKHKTVADNDGNWKVKLDSMKAGGPYVLSVKGENKLEFKNVLIGEVWVCSGQSNMGMSVAQSNHSDIEIASANYPDIRLMTVPRIGADTPQDNFESKWVECSPKSVRDFSAIGYFFGRRLHHTLGVPIGLINNAWGGSAIEAWIPTDVMKKTGEYDEFVIDWEQHVSEYSDEKHALRLAEYDQWLKDGKPGKKRWKPEDIRIGRKRPGNIYNAMVYPLIGYGIKGTIWCQGESNVGRAYQYRSMFPLMINTLRKHWEQGDFPFYWVQLADFNKELKEPTCSSWAELREAQTMTLSLPNTGEAVVFDTGESRDIHPRDKQTSANRLVCHALTKDYGYDFITESPRYSKMEVDGNKAIITFNNVASKLYSFDVDTVYGFTIAGEDQKFERAHAKIISKNQVEVYSRKIIKPVAVRYGWADNPVVNLYDRKGLPLTPFRTDDWPGITVGRNKTYWGK